MKDETIKTLLLTIGAMTILAYAIGATWLDSRGSECYFEYRKILNMTYTEEQARTFYRLCEKIEAVEVGILKENWLKQNKQEWLKEWAKGTELLVMERLDITLKRYE
jgi:hypothetical protein